MFFDQDCSTCAYLDSNKEVKPGKYYCERNKYAVPASSSKCNKYCSIMSYKRSTSEANELYRNSKNHGYYILTAITLLLNLDDNNEYLESFKYLRDYIMPTFDAGIEFTDQYDEFGPRIAEELMNDDNRIEYASYLLENYIKPMKQDLDNGLYNLAFDKFKLCYNQLYKKYNINLGNRLVLKIPKEKNID